MKIPKFKNEDEEAQWWSDNREQLGKEAAEAMRQGKTRPLTKEMIRARIKASKEAQVISIRMAVEDLEMARKQAAAKGLPYQTYIKSVLHEELVRRQKRA